MYKTPSSLLKGREAAYLREPSPAIQQFFESIYKTLLVVKGEASLIYASHHLPQFNSAGSRTAPKSKSVPPRRPPHPPHLVGGPEEVAAQRHHPALVRLLQELGRVLGGLGGEGVVVGVVEPLAGEQRPRHRHQRSHLRLAIRQLVLVENEGLPRVALMLVRCGAGSGVCVCVLDVLFVGCWRVWVCWMFHLLAVVGMVVLRRNGSRRLSGNPGYCEWTCVGRAGSDSAGCENTAVRLQMAPPLRNSYFARGPFLIVPSSPREATTLS